MANRLTEMSDSKVLLLEAGGDETIISDIPGVVHHLQRTNIDWSYKTVPQTGSCLAFKDNRSVENLKLANSIGFIGFAK